MEICQRGFAALLYPCVLSDWPRSRYGYGEQYVKGTANKPGHARRGLYLRAHVFELERKLGRPLQPGMQSNHHCDERACVQHEHLYEGTQIQNVQDMWDRKRGYSAYAHGVIGTPRALTGAQESEVRRRYALGSISQAQLAREFGISQPTISRIILQQRGHGP
jgi:hypothetical protein